MRVAKTPQWQDRKTADDAMVDHALMCRATGCPRRWSNDFGGARLCTMHSRCLSPHDWPRVTQQLLDADLEQARSEPRQVVERHATKAEGIAALRKLAMLGRQDPRAWANRLLERAKRGETMTRPQREALLEVFGADEVPAPKNRKLPFDHTEEASF